MTTNNDTLSCSGRLVALLSGGYLVSMVIYLILRLIFGDNFWWLALLNAFAIYTFFPLIVLIPLAFLSGLWRDFIRLGVMGLLAVIWFGPFFQPVSAPNDVSGTPLDIVTVNMQANANDDPQAIVDWLQTVNADIVFMQETPAMYAEGLDVLASTLPEQVSQGNGRLVLSRYPLVVDGERVVMTVAGQDVALYNVHLPWPFRTEDGRFNVNVDNISYISLALNYDERERNRQLEDLLVQVAAEPLPFIVAGDFNMSQHSLVYSDVTLIMDDAYRKASGGLGNTWPAHLPLLRLDYVWYGTDLRALASSVGPQLSSDHRPLLATLSLDILVEEISD
jgi:vancomycin resistance protein VanJ